MQIEAEHAVVNFKTRSLVAKFCLGNKVEGSRKCTLIVLLHFDERSSPTLIWNRSMHSGSQLKRKDAVINALFLCFNVPSTEHPNTKTVPTTATLLFASHRMHLDPKA